MRLIGPDGNQVGVVSLAEAQKSAEENNLDLVEIVPTADPPVCRVMDFGKFLFELSKKRHAQKRKQKQIQVKEIKLRPGTDEGDYQIKLRNMIRFLDEGDKVKVTLRFRGTGDGAPRTGGADAETGRRGFSHACGRRAVPASRGAANGDGGVAQTRVIINILRGRGMNPALDQRGELRFSPLETPSLRYPRQDRGVCV